MSTPATPIGMPMRIIGLTRLREGRGQGMFKRRTASACTIDPIVFETAIAIASATMPPPLK